MHLGLLELGLGRGSSCEPESCIFVPPEQDLARGSSVKPEPLTFGSPEPDLTRGSSCNPESCILVHWS